MEEGLAVEEDATDGDGDRGGGMDGAKVQSEEGLNSRTAHTSHDPVLECTLYAHQLLFLATPLPSLPN